MIVALLWAARRECQSTGLVSSIDYFEFLAIAKLLYPFGLLRQLRERGAHMEFARAGDYPWCAPTGNHSWSTFMKTPIRAVVLAAGLSG